MHKSVSAISAHDAALAARHAAIDERLAHESLRPIPDSAVMAQLKKEKLKIKDSLQHS